MAVIVIPAVTTVPPGPTARSASSTTSPAGAKTMAASRGRGGARVCRPWRPRPDAPPARGAAHSGSQRAPRARDGAPGRGRHAPRSRSRRGRAAPGRQLGAAQGAPADDPRAQERRQLRVILGTGRADRHRPRGPAPPPRSRRPRPTPCSGRTGRGSRGRSGSRHKRRTCAEPGDPHTVSLLQQGAARTQGVHASHRLVPGNEGQASRGEVAVHHVEVGAAHGARAHAHADLSRAGLGEATSRRVSGRASPRLAGRAPSPSREDRSSSASPAPRALPGAPPDPRSPGAASG